MKRLIVGFGFMLFFAEASAQVQGQRNSIETGLEQAGVFLTGSANEALKRQVAEDFASGAQKAGFSARQTTAFSDAIKFGKVVSVPGGKTGYYVANVGNVANDGFDSTTAIPEDALSSVNYLFSFSSPEKLGLYLQKFSTIKIEVQPVPPRDYTVVINGESCPATEKGEYKVLPGDSAVNVARPSRPACEWKGPIAPGQTQLVACKF